MKKRVQYTWTNSDCANHDKCDCDLTVKLLEPQFEGFTTTVYRYQTEVKSDGEDMMIKALAAISSTKLLVGNSVVSISKKPEWEYVRIQFSHQVFGNMTRIPPLFMKNTGTREQDLTYPGKVVARALQKWDVSEYGNDKMDTIQKWSEAGVFKKSEILHSPGTKWDDIRCPIVNNTAMSMSSQCMMRLSTFNMAFTGSRYGQYQRHTLKGLYPYKLVMGLKKLDQPTNSLNIKGKSLSHLLKPAMDMMYKMMGTDKHFKSVFYDPDHDVYTGMPLMSSAGCRSGPSRPVKLNCGPTLVHTVAGKKIDQLEYVRREYDHTLSGAKRGHKVKRNDVAFIAVQKAETINDAAEHNRVCDLFCDLDTIQYRQGLTDLNVEIKKQMSTSHKPGASLCSDDVASLLDQLTAAEKELKDLRMKYRNYIIPFASDYPLNAHVQKHRQGFERGGQIRIGGSWWNGGGQRFQEYLHMAPWQIAKTIEEFGVDYTPVISDGDIRSLDLSIKRFFMELYTITGGRYYKFRSHEDERTYKIMVEHCLEAISARATHLFGDEWRIIKGGMPSGSYITSHGDSWIMLLMFCLFVQRTRERYPHLRKQIDLCVSRGWINIVLYGDDHILRTIRALQGVIGEQQFVNFLYEFFDMKSRDVREDVPFLSVPDTRGGLRTRGIIFLKKYFIELPPHMIRTHLNMPSIVPYRTLDSYVHRIAFGANMERSEIDQILSCIGNAYDTMGTNLTAYRFLHMVYSELIHSLNITPQNLKKMMAHRLEDRNNKDITKLMRKCNLTSSELLDGFPTLDLLVSKNALSGTGDFQKRF